MSRTTKSQLTKWMRKGKRMEGVKESRTNFITDSGEVVCACALGLALIGKHGSARKACREYKEHRLEFITGTSAMANLLGISKALALKVEDKHCNSGKKAWTIAGMLEKGSI